MQITFLKHLGDIDVEFNRLLYPVQYQVLIRVQQHNPVIINFKKNENNNWEHHQDNIPEWVNPLLKEIIFIIKDHDHCASAG